MILVRGSIYNTTLVDTYRESRAALRWSLAAVRGGYNAYKAPF